MEKWIGIFVMLGFIMILLTNIINDEILKKYIIMF